MNDPLPYKNFEEFFKKATGYDPYPYQVKIANASIPSIINVPTGAGKTEAAILGLWMWRRLNHDSSSSTRLIYCLPMRVLVEQTVERIKKWLKNLNLDNRIGVISLMGGNKVEEFQKHPAKEYVIIGTQDMLVSGALNRAYGKSPYAWPIFFGLFNNDCMWIMDEIQIMENAVPTSRQLDGFRSNFGAYGQHKTVWMSATINPEWLETVNFSVGNLDVCHLEESDKGHRELKKRNDAVKTLHKAKTVTKDYDKNFVKYLHGLHKKGTVTAIMVNTVKKAQTLYDLFTKEKIECKLIHSRFRASDRKELNEWISDVSEDKNAIIISTQVLEAGVDISVRTLITEIAPWSNLVQRFGRCNRKGTMKEADIYWIDITDEKKMAPYDSNDITHARRILAEFTEKSVGPNNLPEIQENKIFDSVLREKDLLDLFDNTSDLSGNYTDASRFVRTMERRLDVEVFWRDVSADNYVKQDKPERNEICNVQIGNLKEFLNKKTAYVWNHAEGEWTRIRSQQIFPGQTVMLNCNDGGYSKTYGWNDKIQDKVVVIQAENTGDQNDSNNTDHQSRSKIPVTLEDHTIHVCYEMKYILDRTDILSDEIKNTLNISATYHDIGKAHKIFQTTMRKGITDNSIDKNKIVWAKSQKMERYEVPGFRHEVVSALAYLEQPESQNDEKLRNLIAYIIISHHGKVRMSMRNISRKTQNPDYLLGIRIAKDSITEFNSKVLSIKDTEIDIKSLAEVGRNDHHPSWTEIVTRLLEEYGPFRLAYMEALIRAADGLASEKEEKGAY